MISVVIPSYRNPAYLDLCLRSLFENQVYVNEIVVVLDGFAEESEHVINKYPGLNVLALPENMGATYAHNHGVIAASSDWILVINDDNVAPRAWDKKLIATRQGNAVITPNQIEPARSIFPSFVINPNLGLSMEEFDYEGFLRFEEELAEMTYKEELVRNTDTEDGSTFPIFMEKRWWMTLGGFDQYFPAKSGAVADWDFFYRCERAGLKLIRSYYAHFFHFASAATRKVNKIASSADQDGFEYWKYKWGFYPQRDRNNRIIRS